MTALAEEFWKLCYRFARGRGANEEDAKDFAQQAWIWRFGLNWHSTIRHLWFNFYRLSFGTKNSERRTFHLRLRFAQSYVMDEEGIEHDIYSLLELPEEERSQQFPHLPPYEQMLLVLVEAGWTLAEIRKAFHLSEDQTATFSLELREEIRKKERMPEFIIPDELLSLED